MFSNACPVCSKETSDKAGACPHCGHPISDAPDAVSTEATGKEWKLVRLTGGLLMVTGAVAWAGNSSDAEMVFFLGCAIYLCGKLGAWWMRRS